MNEEVKILINSHDDLKQHILDKIDEVRNLIDTEQYEKVKDLAFYSDCGDGWGNFSREDYCINFSTDPDNYNEDLIETLEYLIGYKEQTEELKCAEEVNKRLNI